MAVAISLTLCAMASALQKHPAECDPWGPESRPRGWFSKPLEKGDVQRAKCLEWVSRIMYPF